MRRAPSASRAAGAPVPGTEPTGSGTVARALATQPSYILLDEPLAGIDPIAVGEIRDMVGHLKDRGIGVLITDHNVRETLEIVDRAAIIFDGSVLFEGPPDAVRENEGVRKVYLGERFAN